MIETIRARLDDLAGPEPDEDERALLLRLLRNFAAKTPDGLAELEIRVGAGDPAAVRELAHGLKGTASNIGADRFAGILAGIEDRARAGEITDEGARLRAEWVLLAQDLTTVIDSLAER